VEIEIPQDLPLETCSGTIPVESGIIEVNWSGKNGEIRPQISVPANWTVFIK
jgi:hypothetical protein